MHGSSDGINVVFKERKIKHRHLIKNNILFIKNDIAKKELSWVIK